LKKQTLEQAAARSGSSGSAFAPVSVLSSASSAVLVAAGLAGFLFLDRIQDAFLAFAAHFDEEGFVSNPAWLYRPIVTASLILVGYGVLRFVFEGRAGTTLERWIFSGADGSRLRPVILGATFLGIPALFAVFAYAVREPAFFRAYYGEDDLFENATAICLIAAGLLLLAAAARLARAGLALGIVAAACFAIVGAASIFLGLEEISYGQRIFGWETPPAIREGNLQAETNIHNYWTHDVQAAVIWSMGILVAAGAACSALLRRFWKHPLAAFLPDQAFLPFAAAVLMLTSHAAFHEPLEQIVSLGALLYALQVFAAVGSVKDT
jgi:hypothetical protein